MENALLNEKEAAQLLGLTCRTLQKWRYDGIGPAVCKISHRCVRYRLSDLERWIEERIVVKSTQPQQPSQVR